MRQVIERSRPQVVLDIHALLSSGGSQGFDFTCARDVLIRARKLSPANGQPLIDQAKLIIESILGR